MVCKGKPLPRREGTGVACRICFANAGGGDNRDRTDDPLLAKQVLSQLSYAPNPGTTNLEQQDHPIQPTGRKHHRSTHIQTEDGDRIGGPGRI